MLQRRWERAQPFPHLVMRQAIDAAAVARLTAALDEEPAERITSEIYEVMATAERFTAPALVALVEELGAEPMLRAVSTITGKGVSRAKMRGYAFGRGHYLLPHADRDADALRQVAFALYVMTTPDLEGGELELFDCELELGHVVATESAGCIVPEPGMLVLFDVSPRSLHQVREVTAGTRAALSGWFY